MGQVDLAKASDLLSMAKLTDLGARSRGSGTTLPTTDLKRGDRYYRTDWAINMWYDGANWQPENPDMMQGKMWGPGSASFNALTYNTLVNVLFPSGRVSGGVTFGSSALTIPMSGLWEVRGRGYTSGSSGLEVQFTMARNRGGVVADIVAGDVLYKPGSTDRVSTFFDIMPLAAGDVIYMRATLLTNVTGSTYYMNNEFFGCAAGVRYSAPLNGAVPF